VKAEKLKRLTVGGAAVPRSLIEAYDRFDIDMIQAWGMTETGPLVCLSKPRRAHKDASAEELLDVRAKTGTIFPGIEMRITGAEDEVLPWDGKQAGEIEVRGPWIASAYYNDDSSDEKFHDGWLRTGDVASVSPNGYVVISDRAKDVIKSGGEWVSSVDLENALMGHPDVVEAAVIGVPDARWDERPLACVVRRSDSHITAAELRRWLADRTAKFWLPERWSFIEEVPKTSVGKFDKKVLRARHAADQLEVEQLA
jgi:acyl-CoA synthetase (AMP-forming)/AMP-acid ligase II